MEIGMCHWYYVKEKATKPRCEKKRNTGSKCQNTRLDCPDYRSSEVEKRDKTVQSIHQQASNYR